MGSTPVEEGRALVERLGGRWGANGGLCRCPAHDDRTPSLSVRAGRTRLLLHCFAGCAAGDVLRALQVGSLIAPSARGEHPMSAAGQPRGGSAALRIWWDSRSIARTPAEDYLARRGLRTQSPELRYCPRTPHGRSPLTRFRPALIAAVRDENGLTGIHRTFLDRSEDGAAGRKCGLGAFGRGAVRLGGAAPRLGLAEGIETALSASVLFGVPCWAALGAERFACVAVPPSVRELLLFLDHDDGGRRAEVLARKAFGRFVRIQAHYPPRAGEDWNDVLRASGPLRAERGRDGRPEGRDHR